MAGWHDLPVELYNIIFNHLVLSSLESGPDGSKKPHRVDTATLHACSTVSKRFHALANPLLYSSVHILPYLTTDDDAESDQAATLAGKLIDTKRARAVERENESARAFRQFVRTIVTGITSSGVPSVDGGRAVGGSPAPELLVKSLALRLTRPPKPRGNIVWPFLRPPPKYGYDYRDAIRQCCAVFGVEEIKTLFAKAQEEEASKDGYVDLGADGKLQQAAMDELVEVVDALSTFRGSKVVGGDESSEAQAGSHDPSPSTDSEVPQELPEGEQPARDIPNGLVVQGGYYGLALVLLHHLPNLERLRLKATNDLETVALSAFDFIDGGVPIGLASIRELELEYDGSAARGFRTEAVVPFFALPNLRSLTVHNFRGIDRGTGFMDDHPSVHVGPASELVEQFSDDYQSDSSEEPDLPHLFNAEGEKYFLPEHTPYGAILPPKCSFITHLTFTSSAASSELLSRILALPIRLESFKYDCAFGANGSEMEGLFIPGAIAEGLLTQAGTLRTLVITVSEESHRDAYERNRQGLLEQNADFGTEFSGLLGPLDRMEVLERLAVPIDMLMEGLAPEHRGSDSTSDNDSSQGSQGSSLRRVALEPPLLPKSLVQLELSLPSGPAPMLADLCKAADLPQSLGQIEEQLPMLKLLVVYSDLHVQHQSTEDVRTHRFDSGGSQIGMEVRWVGAHAEGVEEVLQGVPGSNWGEE
ncbi:hypothetical protein DL93DRAFT_2092445 [Clavulina sp. PMI_390]|nr:hypothetical protein DL93DRAFT_2092445 [Clavulina sp. PMI_390]